MYYFLYSLRGEEIGGLYGHKVDIFGRARAKNREEALQKIAQALEMTIEMVMKKLKFCVELCSADKARAIISKS